MATYDVIFLGGGPAAYVGAIRAAQLGLTVGVVEKEGLGGTCVLWGCIPAKSLLESAYLANRLGHAAEHGITLGDVKLDFAPAMKRSRGVSQQNSKGVEFLFKKNKITWIKGTGKLTGPKLLSVTADGKTETHTANKAVVIATGSRVRGLPKAGLELNKKTVLSSDEVLVLDRAPKKLIVIGAGAVGCEFADVFNAFGSQVTLIDIAPTILPLEDADVSVELTRAFKKRKIDVLTNAKLSDVKVEANSVTMTVASGKDQRDTATLTADAVLVAAGRTPVVKDIGLETVGVKLDDRGFIKVNQKLETSVPGVYAIGDVAGPPMLAHKGEREGVVVAEVIAGKQPHFVNYGNIPNATYCHPEVASIGLTEDACKAQKLDYKVGKFPFSANGRARTAGETEGFVKIIRDAKYGEILGAHIIGSHATEMIHELAVARENEFTVEEIELAIHAHPTLSEAIAEAALDSMGVPSTLEASLSIRDLGVRSYAEVLEIQRETARKRITGEEPHDVLLLVEHPPVVTLGRSTKEHNLTSSPEYLASQGVELFEVERGGDVTFHGPGQLVGYPIIDLKRLPHRKDLHWYLRQLEQALIDTLAKVGITAGRQEKLTGVWTQGRKIASIGVHARDWVTWHGFAMNVSTDLRYFDLMVPCGIAGVEMTSIAKELGHSVDAAEIRALTIDQLAHTFGLTAIR